MGFTSTSILNSYRKYQISQIDEIYGEIQNNVDKMKAQNKYTKRNKIHTGTCGRKCNPVPPEGVSMKT